MAVVAGLLPWQLKWVNDSIIASFEISKKQIKVYKLAIDTCRANARWDSLALASCTGERTALREALISLREANKDFEKVIDKQDAKLRLVKISKDIEMPLAIGLGFMLGMLLYR